MPTFTELDNEKTISHQRLHWAIFAPVLWATLFEVITVFPIYVAFRFVTGLTQGAAKSGSLGPLPYVFLALIVVVPAILLIVTWIAYITSEVNVTNKRITYRTGLFSKHAGELPLESIERLFIIEPFIGRLLGYGTVGITTLGGSIVPFVYIRSPKIFHSTLQVAVNDAKRPKRERTQQEPVQRTKQPTDSQPQDDSRYLPKA